MRAEQLPRAGINVAMAQVCPSLLLPHALHLRGSTMTFQKSLAAVQSYALGGAIDAGPLFCQTYAGSFSFDDAPLTGVDAEWLLVDSLAMNFMGSSLTEADVAADGAVEVGCAGGTCIGLSYSVDSAAHPFAFVAGSSDTSDAFFATDSSSGSLHYLTAVPEPRDWMMLLAGMGLVGTVVRRTKR